MSHWLQVAITLSFLWYWGTAGSIGQTTSSEDQPLLTFVVFTDAHVFDDGWKQALDSRFRYISDDWRALHWAVGEINDLVRADERIDFVVYDGDLGLQNVDLEKDCKVAPLGLDVESVPVIPSTWAVRQIALELNTLAVNTIYFVPGNNDLVNEAVTDAFRHGCFIKLLQSELASFSPPSPVRVTALGARNSATVNGIQVAGLNSASFKVLKNYQRDCPAGGEGCPTWEIASLQTLIGTSSHLQLLLFTHVPDLKDPYRKAPAWDVPAGVRTSWEKFACNPSVLAIFAGHFHDADRNSYGTTSGTRNLTVSGCVAAKTWVTPPLALKNQSDSKPGARGLLLVKVFKGGRIAVTVHWFDNPNTATLPKAASNRTLLWILCSVFTIVLVFTLFVVMVRRAASSSTAAGPA